MLGLYGVIAYFVAQRTPEIGLRLAVGADRWEVVRMVIGQALRVASIGVAIGVPAAFMLTGVMRTLLYEIEPTDPATFVSRHTAGAPHERGRSADPIRPRGPRRSARRAQARIRERSLFNRPGLRNEELLEQPDGVAVGHACHEVANRGVQPFLLDRLRVQELGRAARGPSPTSPDRMSDAFRNSAVAMVFS